MLIFLNNLYHCNKFCNIPTSFQYESGSIRDIQTYNLVHQIESDIIFITSYLIEFALRPTLQTVFSSIFQWKNRKKSLNIEWETKNGDSMISVMKLYFLIGYM